MTPALRDLADALAARLREDARIQSAWLSGSIGAGEDDAWSDVDVTAIAAAEAIPAILADLNAAAPFTPVHQALLYGRILHAVAPDWRRYDILFLTPEEFAKRDPAALKLLFERDGAARPQGVPAPVRAATDEELIAGAREFLRVMGLAPVMFGRGDHVMGVEGAMLLRGLLIDLMLAENGRARSERSVKRVTTLLTPAQYAEIAALPPLAATRDSLMAANRALAALYLPRAKALFAARGLPWPDAFEDATRAWLKATIDFDL